MRPNTNPFDQAVDDITLPLSLPLSRSYEPTLFFDGDEFIMYLSKTYEYCDVATYSYSEYGRRLKIDRLITGLPLRACALRFNKHKLVKNNHCKIFLGWRDKRLHAVFIGSQNLTSGTNFNLTYMVRKHHERPILAFFNAMWKGTK